jgi:hypothetical protein
VSAGLNVHLAYDKWCNREVLGIGAQLAGHPPRYPLAPHQSTRSQNQRVVAAMRARTPPPARLMYPNDVAHIRQFAEAGPQYSSVDSCMRRG